MSQPTKNIPAPKNVNNLMFPALSDVWDTNRWDPKAFDPPRPPNAFIIFRVWQLGNRKDELGKIPNGPSVKLAEEWKSAPPAVREHFQRLAQVLQMKHKEIFPSYQYLRARSKAKKDSAEFRVKNTCTKQSSIKAAKNKGNYSASSWIPTQKKSESPSPMSHSGREYTSDSIPHCQGAGASYWGHSVRTPDAQPSLVPNFQDEALAPMSEFYHNYSDMALGDPNQDIPYSAWQEYAPLDNISIPSEDLGDMEAFMDEYINYDAFQ